MMEILFSLGAGLFLSCSLFFLSWLVAVRYQNAAVADITWSIGFLVLVLFYCFLNHGFLLRHLLLVLMVAPWSLRLAIYLTQRTLRHLGKEDTRYKKLREDGQDSPDRYFLWIFFCQALLQALVTLPFVISSLDSSSGLRANELVAFCLFFPLLIGEIVADRQLSHFKQSAEGKAVCKVGLWRYSRHPNYFFEWLIWCSFSLFAIGSPYGLWSLFSPVVMLYMLLNVSGVRISEEVSLLTRGEEYKKYQSETSAFFPWFPKRSLSDVDL